MGIRRFFRRHYWHAERTRELQAYLDIETDENIARGMPPDEARYAAHRKLGNPTRVREEIYRMNSIGIIETFWQDIRYGARLLRLNPGFATVAILSLALGIGANTAIFQLLDAVRLRMLPVKNPRELAEVVIGSAKLRTGSFHGRHPRLTNALWEQIRDHQQAFSSILAWGTDSFNLAQGGEAHIIRGLYVSGDFFNVLGVPAILGRLFTPADDRRGCGSPGAVISYPFWQREFGGEAFALGRKLTLDGHPFEIVGITPASFFGVEVGRSFDVAIPICSEAIISGENTALNKRHVWWLASIGRLKPGWSLATAAAQLNAISPGLFQATVPPNYQPDTAKTFLAFRLTATPAGTGVSALRTTYQDPLWLLLTTAGLVLLIACANLANLTLARAAAREREIAVRLAIGASRGRLIRQLLAESLLLAAVGAVLGAALARVLSQLLVSLLTTQQNHVFLMLDPDWRVLAFTAALAVLTCVLFGLTPAVRATRVAPGSAMKASSRGLTAGRERFGLRRVLVVSQVSLSLVLLVGALLFARSLRNLLMLDAGFRRDGILIVNLDLRRPGYPVALRLPLFSDLLRKIRTAPQVDSAAEATIVPVSGNGWNESIRIDGSRTERKGQLLADFNRISPGYFRTLGTPILAGRDFDDRDTAKSPRAAIVTEAFSRKFLNGSNPIGRTVQVEAGPGEPQPVYQIVGLAKDTKYGDLREEFRPTVFVASAQQQEPALYVQYMLHSDAPLTDLISSVKGIVAEVNPDITVDFQVFKTKIGESLLRERLMATLSGFFGFLAAVLATIGLYGVISYMVARRRNEIGIRIALGADRGDVLRMVLKEAGMLLVIGLAAGIALALALSRTASSMLFGLKPYDPLTMILAASILAIVALAASYLPARRAASLDPMAALRDE